MDRTMRRMCGPAVFALALSALAGPTSPAQAQCEEAWQPGPGLNGTNNTVVAAVTGDIGEGRSLYLGGAFIIAGDAAANRVARWDGKAMHALGGEFNGTVIVLAIHGGQLVAGGSFTVADGVSAK